MVYCAVVGCSSNNNKKSKNISSSYRYFTFPISNRKICNLWVQKCKKLDFNIKNARICSKHFSDDDYCVKEKLLQLPKNKWKLKDDAVPFLNLAKPPEAKTSKQEDHETINEKRDLVKNISNMNSNMDIKVEIEKDEFEESSATISEEEYKDILKLNIQRDLNIDENHTRYLPSTSVKRESEDDNIFGTYDEIKILKEEFSSSEENEQTLSGIKTEELMVKSENEDDDSITGFHCEKDMEGQINPHEILLKNTMVVNHDEKTVEEHNCDNKAYRNNILELHLTSEHNKSLIKNYCCRDCQYKTHHKRNLNNHVLAKHDKHTIKRITCRYCGYTTHRKGDLYRHLRSKHYESMLQKFPCDQCNYKTYIKSNLNRHVLAKHDENSFKKYSCNICDYKTHYNGDLHRHQISKHHENMLKKYVCDQCDYKTHYKSHLNNHVLTIHIKSPVDKYNCYHCNYRTYRKWDLNRHLQLKHQENPIRKYVCVHCDFKTHIKSNLKCHILAKHDKGTIKKYSCSHCDYRTHRKGDLNRHISMHQNLKKTTKPDTNSNMNSHILAKHDNSAVQLQ